MSLTFDNGGDYAKFRPTYPTELAHSLAEHSESHNVALDIGCGSGQLTESLTSEYDLTLGTDISLSQLKAATGKACYAAGDAGALPVAERSADLITVAQAAHWIDLDEFYAEAERVAAPGALIALVSYGLCMIDDAEADRAYQEFYYGEFHQFWDERRVHVETGMKRLPFPFERVEITSPDIVRTMGVQDFMAYLGTWSATANARRDGHEHLFDEFAETLALVWGTRQLTVRWPVSVVAGHFGH
ncbi:class I SAM-dependent methyltransferase [Corynebacterium lubricantis]|uniref:class I SAM-dependent methyltransferase n=1 Tax=Corynebacterium lubricantis TaxID=541095 RepID=UPI000367522B|nr:class I SAM-dependent methyltransferase [Corynebacterium lubricantis]